MSQFLLSKANFLHKRQKGHNFFDWGSRRVFFFVFFSPKGQVGYSNLPLETKCEKLWHKTVNRIPETVCDLFFLNFQDYYIKKILCIKCYELIMKHHINYIIF